MDISKLTDQEKSVMLARLMNWYRPAGKGYIEGLYVFDTGGHTRYDGMFWRVAETFHPDFDIYKTEHMALAQLVMVWAWENNLATQQMLIDFVLLGPAPALDAVLEARSRP